MSAAQVAGGAEGVATGDGIPQNANDAHGAEASEELLTSFRDAFSHLGREEDSICAWLTERQEAALAAMLKAKDLQKMPPRDPSALCDATEAELKQISELRSQLEQEGHLADEQAAEYCTDLTLLRYLRAREHHMSAAHAMLVHTLAWRAKTQPWSMENVSSRTNKSSSDARIVGFDPQGRLVVYSSFSNTTERTPDKVTENAVAMMEKTNKCVAAGTSGQVMWINHFCARHKRGFGWGDANPKFIFSGVSVFMDHYPEQLRTMVIVDPPSIFFTLWKVLSPLMPAKTAHKAEFIRSDGPNTHARFVELFGQELGDHLMHLIKKDLEVP